MGFRTALNTGKNGGRSVLDPSTSELEWSLLLVGSCPTGLLVVEARGKGSGKISQTVQCLLRQKGQMVWCESDRQAGHVKMTVQVKTGMFRFKFLKQISDRYLSVRYKSKKTLSHRVSYECPVTEGVVKWEQTRV